MDYTRYRKVLGVSSDATVDDIRDAYKKECLKWHPDRLEHNPELKILAEHKLKLINEAYQKLISYVTTISNAIRKNPNNSKVNSDETEAQYKDEIETTEYQDSDSFIFNRDIFVLKRNQSISKQYYVKDCNGESILFVQKPQIPSNYIRVFIGITSGIIVFVGSIIGLLMYAERNAIKPTPMYYIVGLIILFVFTATTMVYIGGLNSHKIHINFYRDRSKREHMFTVKQKNYCEIPCSKYTLLDKTGQLIATFTRNYIYDFFCLKQQWNIYDISMEKRLNVLGGINLLTYLRIICGLSLIVLALLNIISVRITTLSIIGLIVLWCVLDKRGIIKRASYIIRDFDKNVIGKIIIKQDEYILDMSADRNKKIDRRIVLALGVMIESFESYMLRFNKFAILLFVIP